MNKIGRVTPNAMPAEAPGLNPDERGRGESSVLVEYADEMTDEASVDATGGGTGAIVSNAEGGIALKVSRLGAEQSASVSPQQCQELVELL